MNVQDEIASVRAQIEKLKKEIEILKSCADDEAGQATIPVRRLRGGMELMAQWLLMNDKLVLGDEHRQCSECGWDNWQGPGWWDRARYCPQCGTRMEDIKRDE